MPARSLQPSAGGAAVTRRGVGTPSGLKSAQALAAASFASVAAPTSTTARRRSDSGETNTVTAPLTCKVQSLGWVYCTPAAVLPGVSAAAAVCARAGSGMLIRASANISFMATLSSCHTRDVDLPLVCQPTGDGADLLRPRLLPSEVEAERRPEGAGTDARSAAQRGVRAADRRRHRERIADVGQGILIRQVLDVQTAREPVEVHAGAQL